MLICICCVIFITILRVSFCIKFFFKKRIKKKKRSSHPQVLKQLLNSGEHLFEHLRSAASGYFRNKIICFINVYVFHFLIFWFSDRMYCINNFFFTNLYHVLKSFFNPFDILRLFTFRNKSSWLHFC